MGQITIDYPGAYATELTSGLRAYLGDDAAGLSDADAVKKALKRFAKGEARKVARRNASSQAVADAEAAQAAAQAAAIAAVQARKAAEDAEDAYVLTAFGSDS